MSGVGARRIISRSARRTVASSFWTEASWRPLYPTTITKRSRVTFGIRCVLRHVRRSCGHPLAPNVRLAAGRILIPDLAVKKGPTETAVSDAADVVLVCEITSPGNAATDRGLKMVAYAAAGIPWYLLVEPSFADYASVTLRLFRLADNGYAEHASAKHGETLTSDLPFPMSISTGFLLDY
ncbi:Uma2 family endonuclease [Actinoplanes sp. NPDC026670]|uniref:Uma2 family endonuclease n=1 Tax=Actinoplanes sp. NPDC026670 TaxID=3154700 RepID=UPI0033E2D699